MYAITVIKGDGIEPDIMVAARYILIEIKLHVRSQLINNEFQLNEDIKYRESRINRLKIQ